MTRLPDGSIYNPNVRQMNTVNPNFNNTVYPQQFNGFPQQQIYNNTNNNVYQQPMQQMVNPSFNGNMQQPYQTSGRYRDFNVNSAGVCNTNNNVYQQPMQQMVNPSFNGNMQQPYQTSGRYRDFNVYSVGIPTEQNNINTQHTTETNITENSDNDTIKYLLPPLYKEENGEIVKDENMDINVHKTVYKKSKEIVLDTKKELEGFKNLTDDMLVVDNFKIAKDVITIDNIVKNEDENDATYGALYKVLFINNFINIKHHNEDECIIYTSLLNGTEDMFDVARRFQDVMNDIDADLLTNAKVDIYRNIDKILTEKINDLFAITVGDGSKIDMMTDLIEAEDDIVDDINFTQFILALKNLHIILKKDIKLLDTNKEEISEITAIYETEVTNACTVPCSMNVLFVNDIAIDYELRQAAPDTMYMVDSAYTPKIDDIITKLDRTPGFDINSSFDTIILTPYNMLKIYYNKKNKSFMIKKM